MLFLVYVFQSAVAVFLLPIYWISSVLLSILLISRSKLNPKRRIYETMMLYARRDLDIYRSIYSKKNTVSKREKENMKNKTDKYTSNILPKRYDKEYECFVKENGYFEYRRNEQSKYWMYESINEQLRDSFYHNPKIEAMLQKKEQQVLSGNLTSFIAAKSLLDTYFEDLKM